MFISSRSFAEVIVVYGSQIHLQASNILKLQLQQVVIKANFESAT